MWQLDYLRLKTFQSHIDTYYEFNNGQTTMVYGNNMDDIDGADSNGSGKSVIVRGITIAIIGIPNRELGKEEYIMDGMKYAEIELGMSNPYYDKKLLIERTINIKDSDTIRLTENDVHNAQITSPDEGNKRILELLDISKEDLLNYYIINQNNSHSFFKATDSAKKEIISRFTNTKLLDIVLAEVEADLSIVDMEVKELSAKIDSSNTRIETLNEQVTYEKEQRAIENKELIDAYNEQIEELELEVLNNIEKTENLKSKIQQANTEIKKYQKIKDEKNLENKKQKTKLALPDKKQEKREAEQLIAELDKILNGKITCPHCHEDFSVVDEDADLVELEDSKNTVLELVKQVQVDIDTLEKELDLLDDDIDKIKEQKRKLRNLESQVENLNDDYTNLERKITNKNKEIVAIKNKIKDLEEFKTNSKRIGDLQSEIQVLEDSKQSFLEKIEVKNLDREEIQFWKINFSEMGLKTFLINKVLENLEGHINNTLNKFKVNLIVKINGFTVLKSKKVKETIDVLVSKDGGRKWKPYKRFSGGQQERVNVSGILTLHSLINESSKWGGLNFLALDEFFEGLDVKGQKQVLPILEASGITCLVISHMNNNIGTRNEIYVNYEDGISTLGT